MLCALILCALMVTAAVSCGQKPAQQLQDPPQQEDPQPAPALKIAVDSEPAVPPSSTGFIPEEGQALFGDKDLNDVLFSVDPRDIAQELKLGNYDAAVCAPDQKALQLLGGYESMPLLKDAVIFVHGNIGQENADYNLSSETLRGIYAGTAPLFWDEAQTQPLIPAYGYASDAQDPLWQLMSMQFGFTADAPDILTRGTWDNPVMATVQTGRVGSPLFPLHYNWLFGEAGINGSVISVDGVRPTDATLADGSYPFTLSYYGLYWPSHPQARQIDAILQGVPGYADCGLTASRRRPLFFRKTVAVTAKIYYTVYLTVPLAQFTENRTMDMKTSDFNYELPPELIAQTPIPQRDASRLLVLNKNTGAWQHRHFYDLPEYLRPGDCLILNNSRVLPARLLGHRLPGGGACEVLLLIDRGNKTWECLVRPGKRMRTGAKLSFGDGELTAEVVEELPGGNRLVRFDYEGIFLEVLERLGKMPLPPYIKEELQDQERYQTVYSKVNGSAAAPTAGLHFTQELLDQVSTMGVKLGYVTLHVGLGTFRPVKEDEIEGHEMHSEYCVIPQETADLINETKKNGGRVICVGTTSCRTIESWAAEDGTMTASAGWTDIFIYPGYRFKVLDGLITNFHLPESTLIMLVSALAGREHVLAAYQEAVKERYHFFSFGDAMLIL